MYEYIGPEMFALNFFLKLFVQYSKKRVRVFHTLGKGL
jgi:hypothetical protein